MPDKDVTIEFTGLRPGEKLDEELLIAGERGVRSTKYSKTFVVGPLNNEWSQLQSAVRDLEEAAHAGETRAIHQVLRSLNIGYHNAYMPRETPIQLPQFEMVDRMASKQHPSAHLGLSAGKSLIVLEATSTTRTVAVLRRS